jgi:electron transfer flavoprotein alpha subunit
VIAVLPVRAGELPGGTAELLASTGCSSTVVVGDGSEPAALALRQLAPCGRICRAECGGLGPAAVARVLVPVVAGSAPALLPASPDGRDLAPHLAMALGWPLLAGASRLLRSGAVLVRAGGRQEVEVEVAGPFVVTLSTAPRAARSGPAPRGANGAQAGGQPIEELVVPVSPPETEVTLPRGVRSLGVLMPKPGTADLAEAERVVAAGAGLKGADAVRTLERAGELLGAAVGATRVVTDAGLMGHDRQIGTTGVVARPRLYVAFGVSGAAQHVGGIGEPEHVVSVNTDPSCPMMAIADLAVVADARSTLEELCRLLEQRRAEPPRAQRGGVPGPGAERGA